MIAVIEPAAMAQLCDAGLPPDTARAALASLKPAATFDGARYYFPRALSRAAARHNRKA